MDAPQRKSPTILNRMLRVGAGVLVGVGVGLLFRFVLDYGVGASCVVGGIAAFIGAALAQPEVSTKNVLKGTAGTIGAYNAPRFMRQTIIDHTFGGEPAKTQDEQRDEAATAEGAKADEHVDR